MRSTSSYSTPQSFTVPAAEEKSTETATPAETVPAEPEEESNEKKKEEA